MNKTMTIHRGFAAFAASLLLLVAPSVQASPNAVIEEAVSLLSAQLQGRKDALAEDRDALYTVINEILLPRFDRQLAAQLVLAKHWRTATPEQQTRFIDAFYNNMLHRYADGVLEFDQDKIEVLTFRGDDSKRRTQVKTIVQLADGTKVPVNYDLVRRGEDWKMFNVTIEGVSYIRNFRAEVDSEIRASSLNAVIERLESETDTAAGE
ncbi:MAG: ABC transporter substrate-binding protein [Pseudomonadota bacterium]